MDKSREDFEKNWLGRGGDASDLAHYPAGHYEPGSGYIGGCYVLDDVQGHWQTWQASRKALVVELPDKVMEEDGFDTGHNCAIDYCTDAIRSAGITVKGEGDEQTNVLSPE